MTLAKIVFMDSQEIIGHLQSAGWSQNAIATATGITQPQINRVALGTRQLREDAYRKLILFAAEQLTTGIS